MLCKYRDALGKPNEGVHKHVYGIAINDLLATVLVTFLIWYFTRMNPIVLIVLVAVVTVLIHRLFCVNTTINKMIFGEV